MSALEDSLKRVYKLPFRGAGKAADMMQQAQAMPQMQNMDPGFLVSPEGGFQGNMDPGFLVAPEGGFQGNMDSGFLVNPSTAMPNDKDPLDEMDEETRQRLQDLLGKAEQKASAPLAPLAEELKALGTGEDTQLAHLRPGEVVIPPEFLDDSKFESALEKKFKEFNINPEEAVVGLGIASLNPQTGLEEFGFFKKIGKAIKKVAKKIAPVAGPLANFIPGVGPVLAGAIGAATNVVGGKGLKGALSGALGGYGAGKLMGGIGGLGGGAKAATSGGGGGLGGFFSRAKEFVLPGQDKVGLFGNIGKGIGNLLGAEAPVYDPTTGQMTGGNMFGRIGEFIMPGQDEKGLFKNLGLFGGGQQQQVLYDAQGNPVQVGGGGNFLSNLLGGGGGGLLGGGGGGGMSPLGMLGIGGLAAGLGKLAYEDAKKQTGVPLTPLTTMSPTGRYNIEAEIARRMGQQAPNPVEFGLLPQGTLPELSGGKPAGMMYGGAVEDLQGGMAPGMMYGGPVMAYAQGGAVAMQEGGELDPSQFPRMDGDINGPGTETSDDIPAMLSDGEFVMTGRAVRGAGSYDMEMDQKGIISLVPNFEEDRERGMDLMYKMMDAFSNNAQPS